MSNYATYPFYKGWKANGSSPAAGYKLYTYESGTTNLKSTYSNAALTAANTNPITLDSNGEARIFLLSGAYRFDLFTAAGALVNTFDPVQGAALNIDAVESVADLKSLPTQNLVMVTVLGFAIPGDGGGGTFYFDPTSAATDDGGVIIRPSSAPAFGRWKRIYSGEVNVKWFGAKGDGTTNDYQSILSAQNYVQALTLGGTLYFPASTGNYLHGTALVFGTKVTVKMDSAAILTNTAIAITFNGKFSGHDTQHFSSTAGAVTFAQGACPYVRPQWWGAAGDGVTDDSDALIKAFAASGSQYTGISVNLGSQNYLFTKRLRIVTHTFGIGAHLTASGTGAQFNAVTNPYTLTTAPSRVNCCIVIQDGGSISGISVRGDEVLDTIALLAATRADVYWLVNCEGNFGKNPITNARINGTNSSNGKYLGGVIIRYCTTGVFANFGGSAFQYGLHVDACNIITIAGSFWEQMRDPGEPFYFTNSSHNKVVCCWSEFLGAATIAFTFSGVNNYDVDTIQVGDPLVSTVYAAVRVIGESRNNVFRRLSVSHENWTKAKTWLTGSAGTVTDNTFDETFNPRQNIPNTHSILPNNNKARGKLDLIDLADTTIYRRLGFIPNGTTLSIDIYSRSGAITAPAFELFKLSSGSVWTSQGTMTGADITGSGLFVTVTLSLTSEGPMFIRPTAGTGYVDLDFSWNLVNSNPLLA